jgi:hypothetical protein
MPPRPFAAVARLAAVAAIALSSASSASARTWVIPHILERDGSIANTQFTFDTQIHASYARGLTDGLTTESASIDFYLYNASTGEPLLSASAQPVCLPCQFMLGDHGPRLIPRKLSISVDDLIQAAGGFPSPVVQGFGVVVAGGEDPEGVDLQGFIVNAHTSAFDLSVFGFEPQPILAEAQGIPARSYVVPHVFETSGRVTNTPYTFDTQFFMTYAAGLAGLPGGAGAQVDLYLFDDFGVPWAGPAGEVCNPCSFDLSDAQRKRTVTLEELILTNGGGFPASTPSGLAVLVVQGDAAHVALQGFVVNSHTNAFDVSVFGFTPEEVRAPAGNVAVQPDRAGAALALRASPNPSRGEITFAYDLAEAADVTLEVFDAAGRRVATVTTERGQAGRAVARWNPVDDAGRRLPAGIYYARLGTRDGSRLTRVVYLPN